MIRPLGARVVVKRLPVPERTRGGLYLLGREYPLVGEVLAVGVDRKHPIIDLSVGDMVQFRRRGSEEHDMLEGREVEPDTFIIEYANCLCGMRKEGEQYRVWPLKDHVLLRPAIAPKNGILELPDSTVEEGFVAAIGPESDVRLGEQVRFDAAAGMDIRLEEERYVVVPEQAVTVAYEV